MKLNPYISVDCVIFGFDGQSLKVLVVDRNFGQQPENYQAPSTLKLPGSMVYDNEDVDFAATRILLELTGLGKIYLKQLGVFGNPNRIPDDKDMQWLRDVTKLDIQRVVTIAYYSLIKINKAVPTTPNIVWQDVQDLPELAFDHREIILKGLDILRKELAHEPIVFELLPKKFTIRQLQTLYEIILGKTLDNRNFRKLLARWDYVIQIDEKEKNVAHKPASFFKFDKKAYIRSEKPW